MKCYHLISKSSSSIKIDIMSKYFLATIFLLYNILIAQNYEIKFEEGTGNKWFGGDNRIGVGPRSLGAGQSVLIESDIILNSFSFNLTNPFDYSENPEYQGHAVTLILNIRDISGTLIQTEQLDLPDTFSGGWVTWTNINLDVSADTTLIFTAYLVGAFDTHQYNSYITRDDNGRYLNGDAYLHNDVTSDAEMENWSIWWNDATYGYDPTDFNFWLQGTILLKTDVNNETYLPTSFKLFQNYPNPFNPITTISYELSTETEIELTLFNLTGEVEKVLISGKQIAGQHLCTFNGNQLTSGVYFYQLKANGKTTTKKLLLLK